MAACSGRGGYDQAHLEKFLARLDAELTEHEAEIARTGEYASATGLPAELRRAQTLREQVRSVLQRVQNGETKHARPFEPDAARMGCDGRNRFAYNA